MTTTERYRQALEKIKHKCYLDRNEGGIYGEMVKEFLVIASEALASATPNETPEDMKKWIEQDGVDYANEIKGQQVSFATIYEAAQNRLLNHLALSASASKDEETK